jgi:hypothetical protein
MLVNTIFIKILSFFCQAGQRSPANPLPPMRSATRLHLSGLAFLAARVALTAARLNVAGAVAHRLGRRYWVRYTATDGVTVETTALRGAAAALQCFEKALNEDAQHGC